MALIAVSLLVAGGVKGIAGLGMPAVAVPLLSSFIHPHLAIALLVLPIVVTNLWQSIAGGLFLVMLRRFWPLIVFFGAGSLIGARVLVGIDPAHLLAALGTVVLLFTLTSALRPQLHLAARHESWAGPAAGTVAGIMNGVSLVNGPPLAIYLMAIGLGRDEFVRGYGLICLAGALPLAASYAYYGVLGTDEAVWSMLALIPILAGMLLGERLRRFIDPKTFRTVLLVLLTVLSLNLLRRAFF